VRTNLLNPLGPHIVLASRSVRRRELLTLVGAHFECFPVDVDESPLPLERAEAHVLRLAEAKARAALEQGGAASHGEPVVLLGADTVVSIDREILGKPAGAENAARMLRRLSGRVHEVWTGISLVHAADGRAVTQAVRSIVKFAPLEPSEIDRYVATGEPLDKAGGYAVQGHGALYVEAIEGSYSNVVGLPLSHLKHALRLLLEAPARHEA
jgi:nucleoside triphosphate pyrophosphatase